MKLRILFCGTLMCALALVASQCKSRSAASPSASQIPHLRKQGTATQLIVDGKPFLVLGGELSNNGPTSVEYMKPAWPKFVAIKLNTVLAGVSWPDRTGGRQVRLQCAGWRDPRCAEL